VTPSAWSRPNVRSRTRSSTPHRVSSGRRLFPVPDGRAARRQVACGQQTSRQGEWCGHWPCGRSSSADQRGPRQIRIAICPHLSPTVEIFRRQAPEDLHCSMAFGRRSWAGWGVPPQERIAADPSVRGVSLARRRGSSGGVELQPRLARQMCPRQHRTRVEQAGGGPPDLSVRRTSTGSHRCPVPSLRSAQPLVGLRSS
jgi:hypothetical protein